MKAKTEDKLVLTGFPGLTIIHLDICNSTNDYLKRHFRKLKDRFPVLLISDEQKKGRGRGNRHWFSSRLKGLYASLAVDITRKVNLNLLPLSCGIVVLETLKAINQESFSLKWPNDIIVQNKKIAGILVENIIQGEEIICICGFGINLSHEEDDFPEELKEKSISIKMLSGKPPNIDIFVSLLVKNFFKWFDILKNGKDPSILEMVRKANYFSKGDKISLQGKNGRTSGSFIDILSDGSIAIERDNGEILTFYTGEIYTGD